MTATVIEIPRSIFNFSGQMHIDTFKIRFEEVSIDFDSYDDLAINGLRMAMEAIRLRATQDWVKANVVIEVDEFIILAYHLSRSNVHESQTFEDVWNKLPGNVIPIRSLADSAYVGNDCLAVARQHGATPLHKIKKNAKNFKNPETAYEKLTSFAHHWPKRFAELTAKRAHSETVFSTIGILLGHRLRCRNKAGRKNEVQAKFCLFNLIQLATRKEFWLH